MPTDKETAMTELLYLEDLHPGQKFTSHEEQITEAAIKEFAQQFDPQPFHLDHEAAKSTMFGGLAASGWHTAAFTMRLNVTGGPKLAGGIIGGGGEINWPTPVRPGDTLHVEYEVLEVTPSRTRPERGTIILRTETKNQHGSVVQTTKVRLIVPRRPA
jgi:acyl dehydratase